MNIIRAELDDTDLFDRKQLDNGACCFYTEDKSSKYYFEIIGQNAILHTDENQFIDEVINEFLFYSGFITTIHDSSGQLLKERSIGKLDLMQITNIQPSQFYVNERKLINCQKWIKKQKDIIIPIAIINDKIVSLDGHTRLRAALYLGYSHAYIYQEDYDDCIIHFVNEAVKRNIANVTDMAIISDEEYKLKWHKYCDDFFANLNNQLN